MPNLKLAERVRLIIGGRELSEWLSVDISMAVDQMADSFTLSAPFDPEAAELVALVKPYQYQAAQILLDDDLYLTGFLDVSNFQLDERARTMTLQGRSRPGILSDCSPDSAAQISELTFAEIARQIARPLGVSVRDDDPKSSTRTIPEARAEYGSTAFDFLHKLAAPHNLLLNSSFDGRLVITSADELVNYPIRAELAEGDNFILRLASSFDGSKRYSTYEIGSTFADYPDITGSVTDPSIPVYRPRCKAVEEADETDPDTTAARMMAEAIASSLTISATLDGWRRPDGARWSERMVVTLKAPSVYLFKAARYVVAGCSFKLDPSNGRTTELRLVPDGVYSSAVAKAKKKKVDLW